MRRGSRDNVLAGGLVLAAIGLAIVTVVLLAGGVDSLTLRPYAVKMPFEVGAPGLSAGADVEMGGVPVGQVTDVQIGGTGGAAPDHVLVRFRIDRAHTLYQDARIELVEELLGGTSRLNITSVGTPDAGELSLGDPPTGRLGGGIAGKLGLGDLDGAAIGDLIGSWSELGGEATRVVKRFNEPDDAGRPAWSERIAAILAYLQEQAPQKVDEVVEQFRKGGELVDNAGALIDDNRESVTKGLAAFRRTAERVDGVTQRNEASFDSIVRRVESAATDADEIGDDVKSLLARFDGSEDDPLHRIAVQAETTLGEFEALGRQANQIAAENRADLRRAVARLRLTADQALDTMLEVRRSPWRLLHRPDERETAYELLYDSARQYARAVSDLDSVSMSMRSLAEAAQRGTVELDDALVRSLTQELDESRREFEAAEDKFLDVLLSIEGE